MHYRRRPGPELRRPPVTAAGRLDAGNLRAFIELARSDLKTQKTLIIAQNIQFTDDEAVEFWPLHSEYNLELNKLLDERLQLLNEYAGVYKTMTDQQATALAKKVFAWEEKRTKLNGPGSRNSPKLCRRRRRPSSSRSRTRSTPRSTCNWRPRCP